MKRKTGRLFQAPMLETSSKRTQFLFIAPFAELGNELLKPFCNISEGLIRSSTRLSEGLPAREARGKGSWRIGLPPTHSVLRLTRCAPDPRPAR